jgi:hypothetical protein
MPQNHQSWVNEAAKEQLVRFEPGVVKVNRKDENGKDVATEVPFEAAIFTVNSEAEINRLFELAEQAREEYEDKDGNKVLTENEVVQCLAYGYGLKVRAKVRTSYEKQFEDPDKNLRKVAALLVALGKFKTIETAMEAARALQQTEE